MPYEQVYGVGLLDDLHNYFPALLYDQGRFLNVTHVFHYIRTQMSRRFNLYAHGASLYADSQENNTPQAQPFVPSFTTAPPPTNPTNIRIHPVEPEENLATTNLLLSLLGIGSGFMPLIGATRRTPTTNPWSPVVVAPSIQIINSNTEIIVGSTLPPNSTCSICQDSILQNDSCRRLIPCNHSYHRSCIDQWFQRSVFCPTCRHDIRNSSSNNPRISTPSNTPSDTSSNIPPTNQQTSST